MGLKYGGLTFPVDCGYFIQVCFKAHNVYIPFGKGFKNKTRPLNRNCALFAWFLLDSNMDVNALKSHFDRTIFASIVIASFFIWKMDKLSLLQIHQRNGGKSNQGWSRLILVLFLSKEFVGNSTRVVRFRFGFSPQTMIYRGATG